jgi:hypothetical protein
LEKYSTEFAAALNLRRGSKDSFAGPGFLAIHWRADMPKAVRISIPATSSSTKSDSHEFVSIALFSGIGLLISIFAVLMGVQGIWY